MRKSICILSLAFFVVGCGEREAPETTDSSEQAQEQPTERQREVVRRESPQPERQTYRDRDDVEPEKRIPKFSGEAEDGGYGLTMVVDGSSPEAFKDSLEMIALDTSDEQYRLLDSALRFLGTYDTAAWQGLPNLYIALDGMTGEEIIERARRMREERQSR